MKLDTPQARIFPVERRFSNADHDAGEKVGDPIWPVQQIEIEMISTETSEAFLASARDAVFRHMSGPHLGDQEHLIALTSDHAADEFLGAPYTSAVSINAAPAEKREAEEEWQK